MKRRVFLAVNINVEVKNELVEVVGRMSRQDPRAPVKWVNGDGTHITLHFLGDQDEEAIRRIGEAVRETALEYRPTIYALDAVGFFPDSRRPRVIYVAAKERDGRMLESLREKLGKRLERLGVDVDHRLWRPHITLGRVRGLVAADKYASERIKPLEFRVGSVDLTESRLDPAGAIYAVIDSFPLGTPAHGTDSDS